MAAAFFAFEVARKSAGTGAALILPVLAGYSASVGGQKTKGQAAEWAALWMRTFAIACEARGELFLH